MTGLIILCLILAVLAAVGWLHAWALDDALDEALAREATLRRRVGPRLRVVRGDEVPS